MKKKILLLANMLLLLALAGFGGFYFKKYQDLKSNPASAEQAQRDQRSQTIEKVRRLYASLPSDEEPTFATVSNKDDLKSQPFFDKAENGDVALIYTNAKLAVLYRPSTNQIINVSNVTIQGTARVKVIGSADARKAAVASLSAAQITATEGGNAKTNPGSVTVVDLSGQNADQAAKIATTLKGKVSSLPAGEDKPADTDILVIVTP